MESKADKESKFFLPMTREQARKFLDVGPYATTHDIKSAYRRKAMECYPRELINPPETMEVFRNISIAYRRLAYDFQIENDQVELESEHEFKVFRMMFEDERHVVHVHTEHGSFIVLGRRYSPKRSDKNDSDEDFDASHYSFQKESEGVDASNTSDSTCTKSKTDKKKLKRLRQKENKRQAKENLQKQREEIKHERQKLAEVKEAKAEQPKKNGSATKAIQREANLKADQQQGQRESDQSGEVKDVSNIQRKEIKNKSGHKKAARSKERESAKELPSKPKETRPKENQKAKTKPAATTPEAPTTSNASGHQKNGEVKLDEMKGTGSLRKQAAEIAQSVTYPSTEIGHKLVKDSEDFASDGLESPETSIDMDCAFFAKSRKTFQKRGTPGSYSKKVANGTPVKENSAAPVEQQPKHDTKAETTLQFATEANVNAEQGKYNEAALLFTRAILLDTTNFLLYANRSCCYERLFEFDKALRDAERAISFAPQWSKGHFRKGRAMVGLRRYKEAEKAFEQVLRLDKTNHDADNELYHVRVKRLEVMGFSKQQSMLAIRKYITVDAALEKVLAGGLPEDAVGDVYVSDDEDLSTPLPEPTPVLGIDPPTTEYSTFYNVVPPQSVELNSCENVELPRIGNGLGSSGSLIHSDIQSEIVEQSKQGDENVQNDSVTGSDSGKALKKGQYYAVWIGNISKKITDTILADYFIKFGPIRCVKMHYDRQFAFVNYINPESSTMVLEAHSEVDLHGHHLVLSFPGQRYTPNRPRETPISVQTPDDRGGQRWEGRMYPRGGDVPPRHAQNRTRVVHNNLDSRKECVYWRRGRCIHGSECKFSHILAHQGIDGM